MRKREIAETPVTYANIVERCRKETVQDAGGISDRAGKPAAAQAMAWWIGKGRCSRRLSPSPRYGKTLAVKAGCAPPGNGWKAGPVVGAKARQSGFGPIVELAAGGRGVEARKGIAPGPGDRMRSLMPFAARVEHAAETRRRGASPEAPSGSKSGDRGSAAMPAPILRLGAFEAAAQADVPTRQPYCASISFARVQSRSIWALSASSVSNLASGRMKSTSDTSII